MGVTKYRIYVFYFFLDWLRLLLIFKIQNLYLILNHLYFELVSEWEYFPSILLVHKTIYNFWCYGEANIDNIDILAKHLLSIFYSFFILFFFNSNKTWCLIKMQPNGMRFSLNVFFVAYFQDTRCAIFEFAILRWSVDEQSFLWTNEWLICRLFSNLCLKKMH